MSFKKVGKVILWLVSENQPRNLVCHAYTRDLKLTWRLSASRVFVGRHDRADADARSR